MKRILTLAAAILAVSLYSCGKDDKKNDTPANPFVGSWTLESVSNDGIEETTDCSKKGKIVFTEKSITLNSFYIKPSDNSCNSAKYEFTYTYKEGKVTNVKNQENGEVVDSFITFTLENDFLVYTQVDEDSKTVIKYTKQ
ncbi:lipocalin-like domain-containing protein [Capnocytophaga cynodegmi]|uniref:lipocalin family protein n=1 Tax=Capnocytophaga cynodegmi TaxID=28189 RepID=UPI00385F429B